MYIRHKLVSSDSRKNILLTMYIKIFQGRLAINQESKGKNGKNDTAVSPVSLNPSR